MNWVHGWTLLIPNGEISSVKKCKVIKASQGTLNKDNMCKFTMNKVIEGAKQSIVWFKEKL